MEVITQYPRARRNSSNNTTGNESNNKNTYNITNNNNKKQQEDCSSGPGATTTIILSPQPNTGSIERINGLFKFNFAVVILAAPMLGNLGNLTTWGDDDYSWYGLAWIRLGLALFGTVDLLYLGVVGNLVQFFAHLQLADDERWNVNISKRLIQRGIVQRRCTAASVCSSFSELVTRGRHTIQVPKNAKPNEIAQQITKELIQIVLDSLNDENGEFAGLAWSLQSHKIKEGRTHWVRELSDQALLGDTHTCTQEDSTNDEWKKKLSLCDSTTTTSNLNLNNKRITTLEEIELQYITPSQLVFESTCLEAFRLAVQLFPWSIVAILISELIVALHDQQSVAMIVMAALIVGAGTIPMLISSIKILPKHPILSLCCGYKNKGGWKINK